MKKLFLIIAFLSSTMLFLRAQEFTYPEGNIQLNIDKQFGQKTNWETLSSLKQNLSDKFYRNAASFTVGPNGEIYLINNIKGEIELFDKNGNFIKSLASFKFEKAKSPIRLAGLLNNKYLVTYYSNIVDVFELTGNLFKKIELDYSVYQAVTLGGNIIAIYTEVGTKETKRKSSVNLKDIISEKENQIEYKTWDFSKIFYSLKSNDLIFSMSYPYAPNSYILSRINGDQLLVGYTNDPILKIYSKEGYLESSINTNIKALEIPDFVKTEFKEKIKERFTQSGNGEIYNKNPIKNDFFPKHMPYFLSLQVDAKNNILAFLYTNDKPFTTATIYSTFTSHGKKLGTSNFSHPKYQLSVNPQSRTVHFGNKEIIAIVREGKGFKSPFRLVKFTF